MKNSDKPYEHQRFENKHKIELPNWFNLDTYQSIKNDTEFDLIDFYFNYLIRFNSYAKQRSGALRTKKFINLLNNENEKNYFNNFLSSFEHNLPLRKLSTQEKKEFINSLRNKTDIQHIFDPKLRNKSLYSQSIEPVSQNNLNFLSQLHEQYLMFFMKNSDEIELVEIIKSLTDRERHLIYKYSINELLKEVNENPEEDLDRIVRELKSWNIPDETIQAKVDETKKSHENFEPSRQKINRLVEILNQGTLNPFHDPLHFFTQHIPGQDNAIISIDLNYTNDQLKKDFASTLKALRKTHNTINEAKQQTTREQLNHYFESNFFEYIDIRFWLKHKGLKLTVPEIGRLIDPDNTSSDDKVKMTTAKWVNRLMTPEFNHQLKCEILAKAKEK